MPVIDPTPTERTDNAPRDAQPRADQERLISVIDALLRANADTIERQANEIASLRHALGSTQAERDYALERAKKAEEELTNLRIDHRRAERQAEEFELRATHQEERADALTDRLAAAEADLAAERERRRWYDPRTW